MKDNHKEVVIVKYQSTDSILQHDSNRQNNDQMLDAQRFSDEAG